MEKEIYLEIGKKISQARIDHGLTQKQLAEKIGISQSLYAYYEIGKRRIPIPVLIKISQELSIFVEDLLPVENKKRGPLPKIEKELSKVKSLPEQKQKLVIDLIETIIKNNQ